MKPATRRVLALWLAPAERPETEPDLRDLAAWCRRYAPWTAPMRDGAGVWIEAGGCAHLLGGEDTMCRTVVADLARLGHAARAGLAGTPGAAWALARTAKTPFAIAAPGTEREVLAPLPVAALRLEPATVEGLSALGLRRVGDLYPLGTTASGRAELARRFPPLLLERLDAALGLTFEPISPIRERTRHIARFTAPEPVRDGEAVTRITQRLVETLCPLLARDGLGARRVTLTPFRADGRAARIDCGTARPLAEARTLMRLMALCLPRLATGPGADAFALEATETEPLRATQARLDGRKDHEDDALTLAPLVEKLAARLGSGRIGRLAPRPRHLPERAQSFVGAFADMPDTPDAATAARPLRLFARPAPVAAAATAPEGPPAWFRWQGAVHAIARAEGPERIALDWWRLDGWQGDPPAVPETLADAVRDYWRVEDARGARFWIFRDGPWRPDAPERWYLHGVFP
jgi:protein ImuB